MKIFSFFLYSKIKVSFINTVLSIETKNEVAYSNLSKNLMKNWGTRKKENCSYDFKFRKRLKVKVEINEIHGEQLIRSITNFALVVPFRKSFSCGECNKTTACDEDKATIAS